MKLTQTEQATLLAIIKHRCSSFPRAEHVKKLVNADKSYYMGDRQRKDAEETDASTVKSRYEESGIPIVNPAVETEVGFLNNVFLSDPKIFSVVSSNEYKELAAAIQLYNQQHSVHTKWKRHILKFFRDCSKYNFGVLNTEWVTRETYVSTLSKDLKGKEAKNIVWAGNSIERWDPYNCIFDTSVDPADISESGEFFGLVEVKTQMELYRMIQQFQNDEEDPEVLNITEDMWRSSQSNITDNMDYRQPPLNEIIPDFLEDGDISKEKNWMQFAGKEVQESSDKTMPRSDQLYNVLRMYIRVLPKVCGFDSEDVVETDKIQIWKVVVVNGEFIIRAKRMTNNHDLIPSAVAQPTEDSLSFNTLGNTKILRAFQKLAKQLSDRRLASLDRNINGKGFYNKNVIDGQHLKSDAADPQVPVNSLGDTVKPSDAYFEVPFQDSSLYLMEREISLVKQFADEAAGQNKAAQGQFVKGNRTLEEYNDVMSNADSKQYMRAGAIESQCFSIVKHLLKWNIMQYAEPTDLLDQETGEAVKLDPAELQKAVFDFRLADGLNPASKFLNSQELVNLLQVFQVVAQQQQIPVDFWDMLSHLMKQGKNIDLSAYIPKTSGGGGTA